MLGRLANAREVFMRNLILIVLSLFFLACGSDQKNTENSVNIDKGKDERTEILKKYGKEGSIWGIWKSSKEEYLTLYPNKRFALSNKVLVSEGESNKSWNIEGNYSIQDSQVKITIRKLNNVDENRYDVINLKGNGISLVYEKDIVNELRVGNTVFNLSGSNSPQLAATE